MSREVPQDVLMAKAGKGRLFTGNFVLVSSVWMIVFAGYYLLVATLPMYVVKHLGGQAASIGLVMGLPTISTVLLLPFFGRQSDRRGRKLVLLFGLSGLVLSGPLHCLATTLPLLLALRVFFGVVWAAAIAALVAFIADLSPVQRRGEAMGYVNVTSNIALAIGPAIGIAIIKAYDFNTLFLSFTALAALALAISLVTKETLEGQHKKVRTAARASTPRHLRTILFSPMIMLSITIGYGALLSFLPIYALDQGVDNPGVFFTLLAAFLVLARVSTGRLSDRFGRRAVILPGIGIVVASLLILSTSASLTAIVAVAILFGVGFGSTHSALMALAADYADVASRGAAMSFLAASIEMGIGLGSIALGLIVQFVGFPGIYLVAALAALAGLVGFVLLEQGFKPAVDGGEAIPY